MGRPGCWALTGSPWAALDAKATALVFSGSTVSPPASCSVTWGLLRNRALLSFHHASREPEMMGTFRPNSKQSAVELLLLVCAVPA